MGVITTIMGVITTIMGIATTLNIKYGNDIIPHILKRVVLYGISKYRKKQDCKKTQ
jgi:hypothetical protein